MKVFKFGGASVNSIERIKNIPKIIQEFAHEPLVVIISAMGKTTNALEKVVDAFYENKQQQALVLFEEIKQKHIQLAQEIIQEHSASCLADLNDLFTEVEWLLHDKPVRSYDYYYDQIVSIGELLSTKIISSFLQELEIENTWLDVRDFIRTDNNFRSAIIDWKITREKIQSLQFSAKTIYITQGFIGATDENESTTLGREGSDFSAAIFANILNAKSLTIWKDVEGVMNADPKEFLNAELIEELNFEEVIEMAFYGAQIIHPKTIKPLQNKKIPLYVKCFLNTSLKGTIIKDGKMNNLPPIIIIKKNQVLMNLKTKDFSFVGDKPMKFLYNLFGSLKLKPNLIQTGAINVQLCMDENEIKNQELALKAEEIFNVEVQKGLTLTTIRHYNETIIDTLLTNKLFLLKQQTQETIQILNF
ncbi:MAG: aspartate kinase [Chitinophagaceae bacterium]|nr:aspartate kinase [Chitinophagaceae bacterium]